MQLRILIWNEKLLNIIIYIKSDKLSVNLTFS